MIRQLRSLAAAMAVALVVAPMLSACAGAGFLGSNPQGYAGLTDVDIEFNDDGTISGVEWRDGKEKQNVRLLADLKAGTVDYSATNVTAFEAFKSRADVEKWVASRWPELSPDIRGGITDIMSFLVGAGGG